MTEKCLRGDKKHLAKFQVNKSCRKKKRFPNLVIRSIIFFMMMQSPLLTFHNNQLFKLLLKLEYVEETKNAHKLLL